MLVVRRKRKGKQGRGGTGKRTILVVEIIVIRSVVVGTTVGRVLAIVKIVTEPFVLFAKKPKAEEAEGSFGVERDLDTSGR